MPSGGSCRGASGFTAAVEAVGSLGAYLQSAGILSGSTLATLQSAVAAGLGCGRSAPQFGTGATAGANAASQKEQYCSTKDSCKN